MNDKNTQVITVPAAVGAEPKRRIVEDKIEPMSVFQGRIAAAKHQKVESIETSQEIIDYLNPNGLNGAKYFIYQGVKVYPEGKTAEIESEEDKPIHERLHGKGSIIIEGTH